MTNHPNYFPLGEQVLFRSRSLYGEGREWAAGTVIVVRAADRKDTRREGPSESSDRWEGTRRSDTKHADDCEFIYYDVLPDGVRYDMRFTHAKRLLCACAYEIVPADDPNRWTGQQITTQPDYQLLMTDLDRSGQTFTGHAQADNTIQLIVNGRVYATVETSDLLAWAAG